MDHHCQCESAGQCPLFQRKMNSREFDICRGYDCSGAKAIADDRREIHLKHWLHLTAESQGLGDEVKAFTEAAGVKQCGGCRNRQRKLNAKAPSQHWLTRLASSVRRFLIPNAQPASIELPSFSFGQWQIDTSQVKPSSVVDGGPAQFPVESFAASPEPERSTTGPIPFVWIYWNTGANGDELRWSMRSVKKNFTSESELIVVGAKPDWFTGSYVPVRRVPAGPDRRYRDSLNKLYQACLSDEVPDDFFWIMDDVYLMQPISFEELSRPRHYGYVSPGQAQNYSVRNGWHEMKAKTFKAIDANGLACHEWGTHLPHWINKSRFLDIYERYKLGENPLTWELIYGAEFYDMSRAQHSRGFLKRFLTGKDLRVLPDLKVPVINNGEKAWKEPLRAYLWREFRDVITGDDRGPVAEPRWQKVPEALMHDSGSEVEATGEPRKLAVLSTYFNPAGWSHPRANVNRFIEYCAESGVELFIAEAAYDQDGFVLESTETCHVTQIVASRPEHMLWQKERLLNVLLDQLPDEFSAVAWIDADVEFQYDDWPKRVTTGLERHHVLQLWSESAQRMPSGRNQRMPKPSVAYGYTADNVDFLKLNKFHPGFAWAIRRETLEAIGGFLDNNITGGADTQMCRGFFNRDLFSDQIVSDALLESLNEWRERCFAEVGGDVGCVKGRLIHYWHGDRKDRQYVERLHWLSDFDPSTDIEIDPGNGLWRWTEHATESKPDLVENVRGYFYSRNEDGVRSLQNA